jgi:hypothetical protein
LHRLRLGEIDRRTIAALLSQIEEGGPYARNRVRSSLSETTTTKTKLMTTLTTTKLTKCC